MVYLTSDVQKYAKVLGIDEESKDKLYKTAGEVNKFLKKREREESRDAELGGSKYEGEYEERE